MGQAEKERCGVRGRRVTVLAVALCVMVWFVCWAIVEIYAVDEDMSEKLDRVIELLEREPGEVVMPEVYRWDEEKEIGEWSEDVSHKGAKEAKVE